MSREMSTDDNAQKKVKPKAKTGKTKKTKINKPSAPAVKKTKSTATQTKVTKSGGSKKVATSKKVSAQKAAHASSSTKQASTTRQPQPKAAAVEAALSADKAPGSGKGIAWIALLCSLIALVAGGYAAYYTSIGQQVTSSQVTGFDDRLKLVVSDQQSLKGGFDGLNQKSEQLGQAVESQVKKISEDLTVVQSTITALQVASDQSIEDVKANLGTSVARWQLDELHALLSQVNQYYQFTGDKTRAMQGLKLAQSKLMSLNNPHVAPVSAALAEDTLRLESDQAVDVSLLNNRLSGIILLIPELKFILDKKEAQANPQPEAGASPTNEDKGILSVGKTLLGDIGSLVQHKKRNAPLKPSLDDSARFVLYESLKLKIQAATVAMLRHDNEVFQSQLQQASETLASNFDLDEPKAKTIKSELEAMQGQDVGLNTQAISKALSALNTVMALEN